MGGAYVSAPDKPDRHSVGAVAPGWKPGGLNPRAWLILAVVLLAIAILYFPVTWLQNRSLRRSAPAQAREYAEKGEVDQALAGIDAYLQTWPEDVEGLRFKGGLIAGKVPGPNKLLDGVQTLDSLLRLDPDPPARQEDRKHLVELSIRLGDLIRAGSDRAKTATDKFETRYRFANKIAEQRIKLGADDAESYRLLGQTLERLAASGDDMAGVEAVKAFQKALRRDPADHAAAGQLAAIRMERRKDPAGADKILDDLIKAAPRSIEARLVRARHLVKTGREDRAKADVEAASRLDAGNEGVRIMAATLALRRGDAHAARRHLAAVREAERRDTRLDVLLAQVEFLEKRPDRAIMKIREGLLRTSGTDVELSWRLAYWLIQLGRPEEARPIMSQFRRLSGRPDHPMARLLEGMLREKAGRHASTIAELEPVREEIDAEWRGELEMILGRCHEFVGDLEEAEAAYIKARDLAPSSTAPRQALARRLVRIDPGRAVAELTEGARLVPAAYALQADLAVAEVARQSSLRPDRRDWSIALASVEKGLRAEWHEEFSNPNSR